MDVSFIQRDQSGQDSFGNMNKSIYYNKNIYQQEVYVQLCTPSSTTTLSQVESFTPFLHQLWHQHLYPHLLKLSSLSNSSSPFPNYLKTQPQFQQHQETNFISALTPEENQEEKKNLRILWSHPKNKPSRPHLPPLLRLPL